MRIAVLLTCFNRKAKTLESLSSVHKALEETSETITLDIYLTDDGSTDGTSEAVKAAYPQVNILQGTGSLYWAGGMRNSWTEALKKEYDFYFLLNDDTNVYPNLFNEFINTEAYCLKNYQQQGIYIGSTLDQLSQKISYGGNVFINKFLGTAKKVMPNQESPQDCELGNANIMFVHSSVVDKIGILHESFLHGLADFDYTLMAIKKDIPVLIMPNYIGECTNDNKNPYDTFHTLSLKKRIEVLNSPIGLDFKSNLKYMQRNFPLRFPMVYFAGWFKVVFPKVYRRRFN